MDPNANMREQLDLAREILADAGVPHERPSDRDRDASRAESLAEHVLALREWRAKGGFAPASDTVWNFYLPDNDRSTGWTNHGYVLQFVCAGCGETPAQAWKDAKTRGNVPEGFILPDRCVAVPAAVESPTEVR